MTLPNKITLARMACLPVVIVLFYSPVYKWYLSGFILAWLFGITDFVDGYLARRLKQVSLFGKIIDPIADKLFILLMALYFVDVGLLPTWVMILIVMREFVISDFRLLAYTKGKDVAVSRGGKWKTLFQYFLLGYLGTIKLLNFGNAAYLNLAMWSPREKALYYFLLGGTIVLTITSLVDYVWGNRELLKEKPGVPPLG